MCVRSSCRPIIARWVTRSLARYPNRRWYSPKVASCMSRQVLTARVRQRPNGSGRTRSLYLRSSHLLLYGRLELLGSDQGEPVQLDMEFNAIGWHLMEAEWRDLVGKAIGVPLPAPGEERTEGEQESTLLATLPPKFAEGLRKYGLYTGEILQGVVFQPAVWTPDAGAVRESGDAEYPPGADRGLGARAGRGARAGSEERANRPDHHADAPAGRRGRAVGRQGFCGRDHLFSGSQRCDRRAAGAAGASIWPVVARALGQAFAAGVTCASTPQRSTTSRENGENNARYGPSARRRLRLGVVGGSTQRME